MAMVMAPLEGDTPHGRRERKKRATRLALRAAAIDLSAERGFANVTVEDIADAADVSVRTFFNYFDSKEAAVVGSDPEFVGTVRTELLALPRDLPPLEALQTILMARARAVSDMMDRSEQDRTDWLRRLSVVRTEPELMAAQTKHLAAVERELADMLVGWLGGDRRAEPYAALLAATALAAMRVAGMCWCARGGAVPLAEVTAAAFDALARGLPFEPPGSPGSASGAAQLFGAGSGAPTPDATERTAQR